VEVPNDEDKAGGHGYCGEIVGGFGRVRVGSWTRIGSGESREQLCSFTSFNCGVVELLAQTLLR